MPKPLQNLRIVITNNKDQTSDLYTQIQNDGGIPILFPTLDIIPVADQDKLIADIKNLERTDIAIFISPNAVYYVLPLIQQLWPQMPPHLQIAVPGTGTYDALSKFNFHSAIYPQDQFNTEGLLELPLLQNVKQKHIIIFKGLGGRELLTQSLQQRGAIVTEVIAYQRVCPQIDPTSFLTTWQKQGIDIIICTSENSLQNLIQLVGTTELSWLQQQLLLLSSPRLISIANNLGFHRQHLLAKNATDEALLAELRNWREQEHGKSRNTGKY